jgi:hypothetical protein
MTDFSFFKAILDLSGTNYPTMNLSYQAMKKIKKQLSKTSKLNSSHLTSIVQPMKEKFLKYWEQMQEIASIGIVLDPCYKI